MPKVRSLHGCSRDSRAGCGRAREWCRARPAPKRHPAGSSTPIAPGMSRESRSARCTRSSDTSSWRGGFEQIAEHIFGGMRARAGDAEARAAPLHRHGHAVFDETQVFVERAAQVREARVVRRQRGRIRARVRRERGWTSIALLQSHASLAARPSGATLARRPRSDCGRASMITTSTKWPMSECGSGEVHPAAILRATREFARRLSWTGAAPARAACCPPSYR